MNISKVCFNPGTLHRLLILFKRPWQNLAVIANEVRRSPFGSFNREIASQARNDKQLLGGLQRYYKKEDALDLLILKSL